MASMRKKQTNSCSSSRKVLYIVQDNPAMILLTKVQLNYHFKDILKNNTVLNIHEWIIIRKALIKQRKIIQSRTNKSIVHREVPIRESIPIGKSLVVALRPWRKFSLKNLQFRLD